MSSEQPEDSVSKRSHAQMTEDDSLSDDDMGPQMLSEAPKKKCRTLKYEKVYIASMPKSVRYSKSLMHKENLSFVTMTLITEFLITSSVDGVVKFWKKIAQGIEFVKEFRAHTGEIRAVSVSEDGRSFATCGVDRTLKIFDVITFDLLTMIELDYVPKALSWVHKKGASLPILAVSDEDKPVIHLYDGRGLKKEPIQSITFLHRSPVDVIAYNGRYNCAISSDSKGMIEYWTPSGTCEKPSNVFEYKSSTNLFDFRKARSAPVSITMSPTGKQFATFSLPDRKIRIFDFATGKLSREYDESFQVVEDQQQSAIDSDRIDSVEFGRRLALEREVESDVNKNKTNIIFDESGHFIFYGSISGIKVVNTFTNQIVRTYGKEENFRGLNLALYQGQPQKKGVTTVEMGASSNPLLQEAETRDPILFATGIGKVRFYMFTNETEVSKQTRDVLNEKPSIINNKTETAEKKAQTGTGAVIHTTYGDITIRLFPDVAPKAVENFVGHSKSGYYNNTIFHRVIENFMIQCGDPLGDGTGGESIWGREFEDEFSTLKHDRPFTVSMANAGPNTNGSQFFITTDKAPWLDGKHTIFGRATAGLDVVRKIEKTRVFKEKPVEDIKILNIDII